MADKYEIVERLEVAAELDHRYGRHANAQVWEQAASTIVELAEALAGLMAATPGITAHVVSVKSGDRYDEAERRARSALSRLKGDTMSDKMSTPSSHGLNREVEVCELIWDEILQARSNEDPCKEVAGWEAQTAFNTFYVIDEQTGGWELCHDGSVVSTHEDPDTAKSAAQADHAQRIRSSIRSLTTSPQAIAEDASSDGVSITIPAQPIEGLVVSALRKADGEPAGYVREKGLEQLKERPSVSIPLTRDHVFPGDVALYAHPPSPAVGGECDECGTPLICQTCGAPSPAVPEGWRLAPLKATDEMVEQARMTLPGPVDICDADIEDIYETMLSAAPAPLSLSRLKGDTNVG